MASKPLILLVDDSELTVEGMKSYLSNKYEVITAFNGLDGLKVFEENERKPDLIITDLVMPLLSGHALISHIRQKSPQIPIIAMTGWGQHPMGLANEEKADLSLTKPFEMEALELSISKLLNGNNPKKL